MIRINLLPEEYRKKNRTPLKMMLAVASGVTVNGVLLAWYAWLAFGVSAEIESERSVLQTELDGLTPQVNYHKSLDGEQLRYAAREKTLSGITASRINWTRKVDELITVINAGGEGGRHFVWLDDLNVQQTVNERANNAGSLKASGHSGSDNFAQVANFLEDLENSPFIVEFLPPAPPEGTQTLVDNELIPPVVWAFPLSLDIKTPEQRQQPEPGQQPEQGPKQ
jgi:Tfp pilus assembly protein PilN